LFLREKGGSSISGCKIIKEASTLHMETQIESNDCESACRSKERIRERSTKKLQGSRKIFFTRKERFCWGISNFAGYRSENNFI